MRTSTKSLKSRIKSFDITNKKALIIGIDTYDNFLLGGLPSCKKDAEDLFQLLLEKGYTIFHGKPIIASTFAEEFPEDNSAWHKILEAHQSFFMDAKSDDILLFYFSGHGVNLRGDIFLSSPSINPSNGVGGLPLTELINIMKRSYSKQIVCIIDACYSGALDTNNNVQTVQTSLNTIWEGYRPDGIHLLLSSTAYEESLIEIGNNSKFTKHLIDSIKGEPRQNEQEWSGSLDEFGNLTPKSLHNFVYHRVSSDTDDKQHPIYKCEEGTPNIVLLRYHDKSLRNPERDSEVERIEKLSDVATYYNVNVDRIIRVRDKTLEHWTNWIQNWNKSDISTRKKILLITGVPGCGKSWFTYGLISELFNDGRDILIIKGDRIDKYPSGLGPHLFPIFILDDKHIEVEGILGGVPLESICNILEKSTQLNFAGPVIISMRKDVWKKLATGSISNCKELPESVQERIVEINELELDNEESLEATDKIARSFYESIDGKTPPFKLCVDPDIKKKIIEKSKQNLIILKIFFEDIGRTHSELYKITSEDIDKIISNPIFFILRELFEHYSSKTWNPFETAEILAWLHYIAKIGSMSIGSLYNLWRIYYQNKTRPLPEKVHKYLSHMFTEERPYEWPPALFDIDSYGSIISFHGSVDRTLIKLLEDPAKLIRELQTQLSTTTERDKWNREYIQQHLEHVRTNLEFIRSRLDGFRQQYDEDLEAWITSTLEKWEKERSSRSNQFTYPSKCYGTNKLNIFPQDAYYFLSMFKEFIEPDRKFDIHRYEKFKTLFENVYSSATIEAGIAVGEVATTINRLLYYMFERSASEKLETNKGKLLYQYGAYETDLDLILEDYFPDKNILLEPVVSNNYDKLLLLRRVGLSLMTIGRLNDAEILYDKSYMIAIRNKRWLIDVAKVLQLKSELYIHQGKLKESMSASNEAITLYMSEIVGMYCSTGEEMWGVQNIAMGPIQVIICSLAYQGWILHLAGCTDLAEVVFQEAETLARAINPEGRLKSQKHPYRPQPMRHLRDLWGIYYADVLLRKGNEESITLAKSITIENLEYADCNNLTEIVSQCYRVLGDIDIWHGEERKRGGDEDFKKFYESAGVKYMYALETAQKTSHRAVLTEASLGIGCWFLKRGEYNNARKFLEEAYELPQIKAYKFYKADLEIALAKAYVDENLKAAMFADAALKTTGEIHYYREKEAKDLDTVRINQ